jgi:hypothetical protein
MVTWQNQQHHYHIITIDIFKMESIGRSIVNRQEQFIHFINELQVILGRHHSFAWWFGNNAKLIPREAFST